MRRSVLTSDTVPFIFGYMLLIGLSIGLDIVLHKIDIYILGRYLGVAGLALIAVSFIYSLRKRKIIRRGSPKFLLDFHEYVGWLGVALIIIHAGVHFNAILPWLALGFMLIVVASGFIGKNLLKKAKASLRANEAKLCQQGLEEREIEKRLFLDAITVSIMARWRSTHYIITGIFIVLVAVHSISILLLWDW